MPTYMEINKVAEEKFAERVSRYLNAETHGTKRDLLATLCGYFALPDDLWERVKDLPANYGDES